MQYSIMSKCKVRVSHNAGERVIVSVSAGLSLGSHAGMAHDDSAILRNTETQPVGLQRAFIDAQVGMGAVSDPGGVSSPFLTFCCQYREDVSLLPRTEPPVTVDHPK